MWYIGKNCAGKRINKHNEFDVCADALGVSILGQQAFIVLSDGAGSASKGGLGAKIIVEESLAFLTSQKEIFSMDAQHLLNHVREVLYLKSCEMNCIVSDFAATMLVLMVTPHGYKALQIGDGFMIIQSQGNIERIGVPQKGEYINETVFVTDDVVRPALYSSDIPIQFWALSSDGLETVAIEREGAPHAAFFQPFWSYLATQPCGSAADEEIYQFLISEPLRARAHDDVSLAIGYWHGDRL